MKIYKANMAWVDYTLGTMPIRRILAQLYANDPEELCDFLTRYFKIYSNLANEDFIVECILQYHLLDNSIFPVSSGEIYSITGRLYFIRTVFFKDHPQYTANKIHELIKYPGIFSTSWYKHTDIIAFFKRHATTALRNALLANAFNNDGDSDCFLEYNCKKTYISIIHQVINNDTNVDFSPLFSSDSFLTTGDSGWIHVLYYFNSILTADRAVSILDNDNSDSLYMKLCNCNITSSNKNLFRSALLSSKLKFGYELFSHSNLSSVELHKAYHDLFLADRLEASELRSFNFSFKPMEFINYGALEGAPDFLLNLLKQPKYRGIIDEKWLNSFLLVASSGGCSPNVIADLKAYFHHNAVPVQSSTQTQTKYRKKPIVTVYDCRELNDKFKSLEKHILQIAKTLTSKRQRVSVALFLKSLYVLESDYKPVLSNIGKQIVKDFIKRYVSADYQHTLTMWLQRYF